MAETPINFNFKRIFEALLLKNYSSCLKHPKRFNV